MAQKWYQKASVQTAVVSGVFLLVGACIPYLFKVPKLEEKISGLEKEISTKDGKIQELERELIPFRTLAIERYSKADPEAMGKLGEAMALLQRDHSRALTTIASLEEQVRSARTEADSAKASAEKLEQTLAPRVLTDSQLSAVADRLRPFPGQEYQVTTFWKLDEPVAFANRIHKCLVVAGCAFKKPERYGFLLEPMAGIRVYVHPGAAEPTKQAANALVSALNEQEMVVQLRFKNAPNNPDNVININVGTKL